ncbi:MAG: peptidoglycan-binding protein [Oscillospiraceae bacterium]|nr:peptidoglycan-binding protein [Oscillospiraceae bacterium]
MSLPIVPESIVVHLGLPDAPAENVTVPFADYIRNVASSEIYPTWPENAIRANILAQTSYALNRVYTEYYRSRGYDFDITNTTQYDQAYTDGGEVFENVGQIVSEIFNNYIVRQGRVEPLFAQFCDGVRSQCNGLSQWGTVDLARQGLSPYEILQYYYGEDIDIVSNAQVGVNVPSYPGVPLRRGSFGEEVRQLQLELNRIGKNFPAIPVIPAVTAVFDVPTEQAVIRFQEIFNLAVDGVVGKATWYKVKEIYNGVKRLSELTSEGISFSEAEQMYPRILRRGDSGIAVRIVQYYLAFLGYFLPDLPPISITGEFGQETYDAVLTFQNKYGLQVDGIVGRDTWNELQRVYRDAVLDLPTDYRTYLGEIYPGRFLVRGDVDAYVTRLQTNLRAIARTDPAIPDVPVTGVFDEATEQAVKALQGQLGFEPNGVVGPILWSEISTRGRGY